MIFLVSLNLCEWCNFTYLGLQHSVYSKVPILVLLFKAALILYTQAATTGPKLKWTARSTTFPTHIMQIYQPE